MRFLRLEKHNILPDKIVWARPIGEDRTEIKLVGGETHIITESCSDVVRAIEVALNAQPEPEAPKTSSKKK